MRHTPEQLAAGFDPRTFLSATLYRLHATTDTLYIVYMAGAPKFQVGDTDRVSKRNNKGHNAEPTAALEVLKLPR